MSYAGLSNKKRKKTTNFSTNLFLRVTDSTVWTIGVVKLSFGTTGTVVELLLTNHYQVTTGRS